MYKNIDYNGHEIDSPHKEGDYARQAVSDMAFEAGCGGAIRHLANLGLSTSEIMGRLDFPAPYEKVREAVFDQLVANGTLLLDEPGCANAPHHKAQETTFVQERDKYGKISYRRVTVTKDAPPVIDWRGISLAGNAPDAQIVEYRRKATANGEAAVYASCNFASNVLSTTATWKPGQMPSNTYARTPFANARRAFANSTTSDTFAKSSFANARQAVPDKAPSESYAKSPLANVRQTASDKAPSEDFAHSHFSKDICKILSDRQLEYLSGIPWPRETTYHVMNPRMEEIILQLVGAGAYHGAIYFTALHEKLIV